jgi:RimJ/RimL family protein N-acetyltransferase
MADIPVLSDGVVTLRQVQLSDVDEIIVQCTDPESIQWTTVPVPYTQADGETFVTKIVPEGWRTRTDLTFAIEAEHPDGERKFSGSVSLRPVGFGVARVAFGLHPAVRGHGVCTRAVRLLLNWGFQQPDIDVVEWHAFVGNWSSWRVAWAAGFTFHGTVKGFLPHRTERRDAWYGSLRTDDDRAPKHKWNVSPVLESSRLRLRPHRLDDGPRWWEVLNDERSRHFAGRTAWIREIKGPDHLVNRALEANARGERYDWTIADRETDEFVGQIQMFRLGGLDDTSSEVGYSMHPSRRGQGVLTEALGLLVEWAFSPNGPGLRRLTLTTATTNSASRHAAEKTGFTHVATEPEAFPTGEKGFSDEAIYAQLNPAWTEPSQP